MTGPAPRLVTRLALLHTGLFLASGVVLLAVVDLPLLTADHVRPAPGSPPSADVHTSNVPEVLRYSAVALAVLVLLSAVLGWLTAHRALRPLRALTASARAISASNLPGRVPVDASYREFTELAATLDGLTRRLAASFAAQRHFVANASHELRTPVAAQRTLLEVTLADPDATAAVLRAACLQALTLGEEQEHLIGALLTLAHGQRGLDRREPVDLADVARAVVRARAAAELRLHTALASAPVAGDPHLIASLVTNLVDNALRHNVAGGTAEVTTAADRISVGNTGPVIHPQELARLFQPFQRHGTDRTRHTGGHGLGLAIVAAIADAHGATITAHPRPHGGLDITVRFPPAPAAAWEDRPELGTTTA
ncbi:HAMP domain-containing histidine kinase [Dactylosporangium sp. NBC_01737]|uniref:HAMP domain-containing sensor histidine kinase n=1 Tax=Dactylosporangium sp. NBC_01737 TaxID=2975959 RepID=UPI002E0DF6CE|nr:HAMP domain-containing histidine kinase [Dactylosporangium sp. NBC_01737]